MEKNRLQRSKLLVVLCLFPMILGFAVVTNAYEASILLNSNPPPLSAELIEYISYIQPQTTEHPLVGFNGADVGEGAGNGINEFVGFSFQFHPFSSISSAFLTIGITPNHLLARNDELLFADNSSEIAEFKYGNDIFGTLVSGNYYDITFNLANIGGKYGLGNYYDLTNLLLDGDLNVLYTDDAFIHYAQLDISGDSVPIPGSILMLLSGLIGIISYYKFFK